LSDNGGPLLEGAATNGSTNRPLRGGKAEVWEGGIRVPFFLRWPGRLEAGKVLDGPVISLDILPTTAALAGEGADPSLDGMDILPWVEGKTAAPQRTPFFWKFYGQRAVRDKDLKMVRPDVGKPLELYRLPEDIGETRDLAPGNPEKVDAMKGLFEEWNKKNAAPLNQK